MSATGISEAFDTDGMEVSFPHFYQQKDFLRDASRLRDLARKRTREPLNDAELAEVPELRRRLKRADGDSIMLLVIESRLCGGLLFF